ncbi:hypothetical protein ACFFWC_29220 [Plantactinospora siamensis]|uniref:Lipoprotein n=1 Tax=Plantactinospora siamensis TaxID=555372 RepID=A0ABV6NZX7_9ACTN
MAGPVPRPALLAAVLLLAPLGLTACSLGGGGDSGGGGGIGQQPTEDAGQQARERVQAYLDALKVRNVATAREQLCAPLRDSFDASATGPGGEFAKYLTVTGARVTGVTPEGGRQRVTSAVSVRVGKQSLNRSLSFAVQPVDGAWCIAEEAPAATDAPAEAPSAAPTPSS